MRKGFTLLELLIVISVLVIIINIAIPRFKGMRQNGQLARVKGELETLTAALESYKIFDSSLKYPPTTTTVTATYLAGFSPNITNVLYDPFGATATTEYNYMASSNGKYYVVWSAGFSGQLQPSAISDTGVITF